jgi:hypothetical protein
MKHYFAYLVLFIFSGELVNYKTNVKSRHNNGQNEWYNGRVSRSLLLSFAINNHANYYDVSKYQAIN